MKEITTVERTGAGFLELAKQYIRNSGTIISKNYDLPKAMNSLYLNLVQQPHPKYNNRPVLEVCTQESIYKAITECIDKELTPLKSQCYFIPYGDELKNQNSYFGNEKMAKDLANVIIRSQVVREGDSIDSEIRVDGSRIIHHKPDLKCIDKPIIMAYAVATDASSGRVVDSDIMGMTEIKKSWLKSNNGGKVSKEFPHEMARRTVINRLAKHFINTSDDSQQVIITNPDGTQIKVDKYADLAQDGDFIDVDYTINTDEQIAKEKEQYKPKEEDVVTADILNLSGIDDGPNTSNLPEGAVEIPYGLVKGGANKEHFKVIQGTYNKEKYTCFAVPLTDEALQMINQ